MLNQVQHDEEVDSGSRVHLALGRRTVGVQRTVVVAGLRLGQLSMLLRSELLLDVTPYTKVEGQPFKVSEMTAAIAANLEVSR